MPDRRRRTSYFSIAFTGSVFLSGWLSGRLRVRKMITAFGDTTATLGTMASLFLNLELPRALANWGWATQIVIAGGCCFAAAVLVSFGEGPWRPRRRVGYTSDPSST